jgi:transposase
MARATKHSKQIRKQYSAEYKTEALALAARVGVAAAAQQLGLHESQLYDWRGKAKREQGQGERQLATENARLKRQLAEQAEELAILKNVWSAPGMQGSNQAAGDKTFASMYPACLRCAIAPGLDGIRAHGSS